MHTCTAVVVHTDLFGIAVHPRTEVHACLVVGNIHCCTHKHCTAQNIVVHAQVFGCGADNHCCRNAGVAVHTSILAVSDSFSPPADEAPAAAHFHYKQKHTFTRHRRKEYKIVMANTAVTVSAITITNHRHHHHRRKEPSDLGGLCS